MFDLVYESKIENANIERYVILVYWLKNIFFNEIIDLLLSKCCKLKKNDVYDRIELKCDSE
jgi:hypothetical protein